MAASTKSEAMMSSTAAAALDLSNDARATVAAVEEATAAGAMMEVEEGDEDSDEQNDVEVVATETAEEEVSDSERVRLSKPAMQPSIPAILGKIFSWISYDTSQDLGFTPFFKRVL